MALTVTRKEGERITLTLPTGETITVEIGRIEQTRRQVKIRVDAPQTIKIAREEP